MLRERAGYWIYNENLSAFCFHLTRIINEIIYATKAQSHKEINNK